MHNQPPAEVVEVTPSLARQWLAKNHGNRPLSQSLVNRYSDAMKRGEWRLNGETIIFSKTDRLLNGQHRLTAVADADVTVPMHVIRGIEDDAFVTIDMGKIRSPHQLLALSGEQNTSTLATALGWIHRYDNGKLRTTQRPSISQMQELLRTNSALRESVSAVKSTSDVKSTIVDLLPPGLAAFVRYKILSSGHPESAHFIDRLVTGEQLPSTSPILLLRSRLSKMQKEKTKHGQLELMVFTAKAWNAFVNKDETLKQLKWGASEGIPRFYPDKPLAE